jgi:hypothetical protein
MEDQKNEYKIPEIQDKIKWQDVAMIGLMAVIAAVVWTMTPAHDPANPVKGE